MLSDFFLLELFSVCLKRKSVVEIASQHLQYHFLPSKEYKLIWQQISNYYFVNKQLITLGVLGQHFSATPEAIDILRKVSNTEPPDESVILDQLEIFVKKMIFVDAHKSLAEKYNKQDNDGAFDLLVKTAEKLSNFTITAKNQFHTVVGGIKDRIEDRKNQEEVTTDRKDKKIPTGIMYELDTQLKGGIDRGDTFLWLAGSGEGKSKAMKYSGYYNAKIGNRVVHIQAEGTLNEALEQYDAAFIGQPVDVVETGLLDMVQKEQLDDIIFRLKERKGEIFVKAFEQFGDSSLIDVRSFMNDVVKTYGGIDLLILDYLELMQPGDKSYKDERLRRSALGEGFKNLCMEFNCSGMTATQAMDIPHKDKNDPSFVLRRQHISEFKGMLKPFSYLASINGTEKEIQQNLRRVHLDKWRKYALQKKTFTIATNFDNERFYDSMATQMLVRYGRTH
jgi:hypothetical protein